MPPDLQGIIITLCVGLGVFLFILVTVILFVWVLPRAPNDDPESKLAGSTTDENLSKLAKVAPKSCLREWWATQKEKMKLTEHDTNFVCAICLDPIAESASIHALKCNHVFHDQCLEEWFLHFHFTCPLCHAAFYDADA
ncbi:hypothetical protein ASPZODRAFT_21150 [Penicilliopsis zonata CBS 506.65]|uniref:RING-type domain-containing protein n=1 Tax=Penicilliopsis zonata CBS 506.65 TaxID=1073090 RepID=A0A1L9STQ0_9EURO|nr:hypothetical protein ASPZODRAFT_21150 [Penicilliopsis zonata CBS 506.65]OJJ50595.1 hypothetical protein ASPZODRAFT_21150 [Penicilliopsis zonata CBS 506.65]